MAFELYKPGPTSTTPMEDWLASGAIAAGDVVKLVAAASATAQGKVSVITGGQAGTDYSYGVAAHAAADGEHVAIIPHRSGQVWKADAAANCDNTKIGLLTTYLAASTLAVTTGGTITNNGNRVVIIGHEGPASARKYLVVFNRATIIGG